ALDPFLLHLEGNVTESLAGAHSGRLGSFHCFCENTRAHLSLSPYLSHTHTHTHPLSHSVALFLLICFSPDLDAWDPSTAFVKTHAHISLSPPISHTHTHTLTLSHIQLLFSSLSVSLLQCHPLTQPPPSPTLAFLPLSLARAPSLSL